MAKGFAVISGSNTVVHELLESGRASFSGSVEITGSIIPNVDGLVDFGRTDLRWNDVHAVQTTVGAIFETGLTTEGIGKYPTGTVLVWHNGGLMPCFEEDDTLVLGVAKHGKDQPIILGAEPVLVTGKIKEGDLLVTSNKPGRAKTARKRRWFFFKNDLTGKVIAQALEKSPGGDALIKCMIHKA